MNKSSKFTDVYEPNNKVKITVTNVPMKDDEGNLLGYKSTVRVSLKETARKEKLKFLTDTDISKFINDVDFEEEQERLL